MESACGTVKSLGVDSPSAAGVPASPVQAVLEGVKDFNLKTAVSKMPSSFSIPIELRPVRSAASIVVPEPIAISRTVSPSFV